MRRRPDRANTISSSACHVFLSCPVLSCPVDYTYHIRTAAAGFGFDFKAVKVAADQLDAAASGAAGAAGAGAICDETSDVIKVGRAPWFL